MDIRYAKMLKWFQHNHPNYLDRWIESVSPNQIICKRWLVDTLKTVQIPRGANDRFTVEIVGGWYGFPLIQFLMEEYGNQSSDSYNPWPVVVPNDDVRAIDLSTGMITDIGIIEAFGSPGTPTLQLIDGDGRMVWESASYYYDEAEVQEMESIVNELNQSGE